MGVLVEQDISTLFQGVSRQPDTVRLPGQVQEADNALMSVVTGGFSPRPATQHIAELTAVGSDDAAVYSYERDENEQYIILVKNGDLLVYDLDGNQKTVTFPNGKSYLTAADPENDFSFVTIGDFTFIANKNVTVKMVGAGSEQVFGPVKGFSHLPRKGEPVPEYLSAYDTGSESGKWDDTDTGCVDGAIWKIEPGDGNKEGYYFVKLEKGDVWTWEEAADPNFDNQFDPSTMPHELVRNADGTFTFRRAEWNDREVGDPVVVPDPDFVGLGISDLVFHRDRLGFVAGETIFFSQAGDYRNFWPDQSIQVLDSDPFGRVASSSKVNNLRFAVPFRKTLFATADKAQFELTGDPIMTPRTATFDLATSYAASARCRPVTFGSELYFAADADKDAVVFEYSFEEATLSNTAADITKHAKGYIPGPLIRFAADTTTDTLFALSDSERNALYVYRLYWDGDEKAQSSWSRWTFGEDAHLLGMESLAGALYLVIRRGSKTFLEMLRIADGYVVTLENETLVNESGRPVPVSLDRKVKIAGSYDPISERTTWTLPYEHNSAIVGVLSDDFPVGSRGRVVQLSYDDATTVSAMGDLSGGGVLFGVRYRMEVQLSKIFLREGETNRAVTNGRLQLKRLILDYQNSGYFEVHITPRFRPTKVYKFTGRYLGDGANKIGITPILNRGVFQCRVGSRGDETTISIVNESHVPCTITSAHWIGFFNEITRQE